MPFMMKLSKFVFLFSSCLASLISATDKTTILSQLGPYPVTISEHEVKTNRTDVLAPKSQMRRLMVTVYRPHTDVFECPLENQVYFPYAPSAVAHGLNDQLSGKYGVRTADYESFKLVNCTLPDNNASSESPLVLFSPGLQSSRYVHASVLQAVASSGYTVIAVDHPYDAVAVVFPDGDVVPYNLTGLDAIDPNTDPDAYGHYIGDSLQPVRVADLVSVLDAIQTGVLLRDFSPARKTRPLKAAVYGHSLGGSTSAGAIAADPRFVGGINMDGSFFGDVQNLTNITVPFYQMGEQIADQIPGWTDFYAHLKGWKTLTAYNNTRHLSFTDLPLIVDALDKRTGPESNGTFLLAGAIGSERNLLLDWSHTVSFMDFVLKGEKPTILEKPSFAYPDVRLVGHAD